MGARLGSRERVAPRVARLGSRLADPVELAHHSLRLASLAMNSLARALFPETPPPREGMTRDEVQDWRLDRLESRSRGTHRLVWALLLITVAEHGIGVLRWL